MYTTFKCFLILLIFLIGCSDEKITNSSSDVFGLYESSRFVEPGSADGGIDIQTAGGYLTITLNDDYTFSSELYIPENIDSNYPKGRTEYHGKFIVSDEIVNFEEGDFIIKEIKWDKSTRQLITLEVPLRGQPFEIILYKYLR